MFRLDVNLRNYTLKQLLTFVEVAREGSITRAAERLFVTQPAVSMQMRQLEDAFGLTLIESAGRNIRLTEAGREFLSQAQATLDELRTLEHLMSEHVAARRGRIDLGVINTATYFIPRLLVRFNAMHPGVQVALHIDNREAITTRLLKSELDLVISGHAPEGQACTSTSFASNPFVMVAPPGHPLAGQRSIPFSALADEPVIVREHGSDTRELTERVFRERGVPLRPVAELGGTETIKQAIMAGMGVSFLARRTLQFELDEGHLALLDVEGLPVVGQWYVSHLRQKRLSAAALAFRAYLTDRAEADMGQ